MTEETSKEETKSDEFDFEESIRINEEKKRKAAEERLKKNKKVLRDYSIK